MPELLLELLSEEIPARMQARAADDLKRLVTDALKQAGLEFDSARAYVTPRRLALVVEGLPEKQPERKEERKGPKVGAPEQAIQGFMRASDLVSIDEAEVRDTPKGEFYFAVRLIAGLQTDRALESILVDAIDGLTWPKSMRWADEEVRWVRPLHNILAIYDGQIVPLRYDLVRTKVLSKEVEPSLSDDDYVMNRVQEFADILARPDARQILQTLEGNAKTVGHRFLAPDPITVTSFADYRDKLQAAHVVLGRDQRRFMIAEQARVLAQAEGLAVKNAPALLEEVAGLVEWPEVLMGRIDEAFMDLPPEVLEISMSHHQKYFSTLDAEGRLANRFLVVANMPAPEGSAIRANIVAGNERVLRARLADARFFWDQDRKRSLASRAPALAEIVFHAKLGSLDQKVDRVQALAAEIARRIPDADLDRVRSAARLAKADLTTGMVGEFPELQGVMGRYYALADGEHAEVAEAIAAHYSPLGPNDRCPAAPVSIAVALADKIDTLVGFWAIDEKPTGSKDPFALRRAALGVIRLIVENRLRLPLRPLFEAARQGLGALASAPVEEALLAFFADRLKVALKDKGVRHDLVAAVFALGGEDDLVRLLDRVAALESFLESDDGANLLVAYRRAANIVRIEEKKDQVAYGSGLDETRFAQDEERALFGALEAARQAAGPALDGEDFGAAMAAMAQLREPLDAFFDEVTVNAEDQALRENRLRLLSRINDTLGQVADFSHIEG